MSINLNDLISRYTIKHDKKIKRICRPIQHLIDIKTFAYFSIEQDGRFVIMSNYPEQLDFFYSNKLYLDCPYLTHPQLFRSGHAFIPLTTNSDFLHRSRKLHGVDHLFLMLQKQKERVEGAFFIKANATAADCHTFLSHIDLLKQFGKYFKREAGALIQRAWEDGYNLHSAKGEAFLKRDPSLPLSSKNPHVASFLKQVSPLTPREQNCLDLFKQGHSAQASASILGISQRTVEHYFENIKGKLGCQSKWDLLDW